MPQSKCPRCAGDLSQKHKPTTKAPSLATMERWSDSGIARASDGCKVEPDGRCPHGHSSWMRLLGII